MYPDIRENLVCGGIQSKSSHFRVPIFPLHPISDGFGFPFHGGKSEKEKDQSRLLDLVTSNMVAEITKAQQQHRDRDNSPPPQRTPAPPPPPPPLHLISQENRFEHVVIQVD